MRQELRCIQFDIAALIKHRPSILDDTLQLTIDRNSRSKIHSVTATFWETWWTRKFRFLLIKRLHRSLSYLLLFFYSPSIISFFYRGWVNGLYWRSKTDSFPVIVNILSTDEGSMSDEVSCGSDKISDSSEENRYINDRGVSRAKSWVITIG